MGISRPMRRLRAARATPRCLPLLAAAATGVKAFRNTNDFSDLARPCIVTLDGDEEAEERDPEGRPPTAPRRVALKAQFVALASGTAAAIDG
jgi:hypothetical protein